MRKKNKPSYDAVIFDLFGTLVPGFGREGYAESLAGMAAALGAPLDEFVRLWNVETAEARATGRLSSPEGNLEYIREKLGLPQDILSLSKAALIRMEYYRRSMTPRPNAPAVLEMLCAAGIRIGLLSDCSEEAPLLWPESTLCPLIETPVFSCREGRRKPDPKLYAIACRRLKIKPGRALYVADGDAGELAGAIAAGLSAVQLRVAGENGYRRKPEDWDGPVIEDLAEIVPMVVGAAMPAGRHNMG